MKKLRFTLACLPYLHMLPLMGGMVEPEGIELNFLPLEWEEIFWRQLRHEEFDGSEISFSSYTMAKSRGDDRFIAIPVFPWRIFRHSCVYINTHKGIEKPEDIIGKTVGVPEYQMTAGLWIRGFFQHEYGVRPNQIHWRAGGMETPGREEKLQLQLPPDIDYQPIPRGKTLSEMLDAGELDAVFAGSRMPACFQKGSPNVKRLFDNFIEAEKSYYLKTSIFPIMHAIALKRAIYEENPWIATSLFKSFLRSKDIVLEKMQQVGGAPRYVILPWGAWETERTREVLGVDWWPYGLEKNRVSVDALCQYSFEQGLSVRRVTPEELFAPETLDEFKI